MAEMQCPGGTWADRGLQTRQQAKMAAHGRVAGLKAIDTLCECSAGTTPGQVTPIELASLM